MKKIISVILSAVLAFSICTVAFAEKKQTTPVIVVAGLGCREYYADYGKESQTKAFPPQVDVSFVILTTLKGIIKTVLTGNLDNFSQSAADILENIFDKLMCDKNGNPKYDNVSTFYYPLSVDNYDFDYETEVPEVQIAGTVADTVGEENTYFYNYDWRLDPIENAKDLKKYIENAKAKADSDKVILIPCSMGGVQTLSYMSQYGYEDIEKIIFMSSAHKGLLFVSELFSGNMQLNQKDVFNYLSDFINLENENADNIFGFICSYFENARFLNSVFSFADKFSKDISNETVNAALRRVLGSMPGMWAFVCDEYYNSARAFMTNEETSDVLIDKIEKYHNEAGSKSDSILKSASEDGVVIDICSHYGRGSIPVTPMACREGDDLIETVCTSNGVTIADTGEYLPDDYIQAYPCSGHNHVSPDNKADASTCLFPDSTWFIKNAEHVGCNYRSEYGQFLKWLIESKDRVSVFDNEKYPQFMKEYSNGMSLRPLAEGDKVTFSGGIKALNRYIKSEVEKWH